MKLAFVTLFSSYFILVSRSILLQSQYSTSSANQRSMFSSYRTKSTDLQSKLIDWFLYDWKNWLLMAQYITDLLHCYYTLNLRRGIFRTQSNIYDGAFMRKWLKAKSCQLFSRKSSIVNVRLGFKYASVTQHSLCLFGFLYFAVTFL